MFAIRQDNIITVSNDIAEAMCGIGKGGYKVTLDALPGYEFHVKADTVDHAQKIAYTIAKREKAPMTRDTDAATIVKL